MRLFVVRSCELFGFGDLPALGSTTALKLPFYQHTSVYEIAFEFILRNAYIIFIFLYCS